ncbi:5'/3'-nucleotidase SurE [Candidatus Sumerlaeota bacterium]|nr:5'/3'-nucleotidase SurE [Candidatus Sumerlaeota bacterium]
MTSACRPYLLLTNDDGIEAPGLQALADVLEPEFDLLIVAPHRERSATGHAISVMKDLRLERFHRHEAHWGWSFHGKPADCVKIGVTRIAKDRHVDLVVAGINKGQNLGINILYSGTVAAAREAAIFGVPAIAFSLAYRDIRKVDFTAAANIALDLTKKVIEKGLPPNVFLNVNVPSLPFEEIKGYAITRQGDSGFRDRFEHVEGHPEAGPMVYRNMGERFAPSTCEDADMDDRAIKAGKVSITPLHVDATAHYAIEGLKSLEK